MNNRKPMFLGEFAHAVDSKGRVAVPTQFRRILPIEANTRLVLVRGADDCIEAHTVDGWAEHFELKMEGLPLYDVQSLRIRRSRLASAREVEIDGQGRVLIPKNLRDMSGIVDSAVVLGVGPLFEIWEPARYQRYLQAAETHYREDLNLLDAGSKTTGKESAHGSSGSSVPRPGDGA